MEAKLTASAPKLVSKARLKYDKVRKKHLLLLPERVVVLNETAASILSLCDGERSLRNIAESLRESLRVRAEAESTSDLPDLNRMEADISEFIQKLTEQGWVVVH